MSDSPQTQSHTSQPKSVIFLTIGVLAVAVFVVILNETIMSVALPVLMAEFNVPEATVQWLTTGFMLTMAVVIPMTGWMLTRVPLRMVYLIAMSLFIVGTLLAAVAPIFSVLVTARVIQASGTAIMMPLLMTTAMNVVPPHTRGRTMGIIGIVISMAPAMGPTVGGFILKNLSWRWMFWSVLPIAVLVTILGLALLRNVTETRKIPLDLLSLTLSGIGFAGLIYGLSSLGEAATGNHAVAPWIPLVIGGVALVIFAARQISLKDQALLNLEVFTVGGFALSVVLMLIGMMALFGTIIVLPMYMQNVLGFSTEQTGLTMLPGGVTMGILGWFVGRLFDSIGPRPLVIPGSILVAIGMWGMTTMGHDTAQLTITAWHMVLSVGLAFLFGPLMTNALAVLPARLYSHGSAIVATLQQVAAAAGTAMFITVMSIAVAVGVSQGNSGVESLMTGIHQALLWGAVLALVPVIGTWLIKPKPKEPIAVPAAAQSPDA